MATVWSILAALAAFVSAGSFYVAMYPSRSDGSAVRRGASIVMVGSGVLTVYALRCVIEAA